MRTESQLPPAFSAYLDAVRFAASVAVVLDHLSSFPFTATVDGPRHGLQLLGNYGQSAVIVFFVLSGYIIAFVTAERERDLRSYVISRASRLYSVVLPALVLTFLLDSIGTRIAPDFYAVPKVLGSGPTLAGYLSSAFFANEFRILHLGGVAPGCNGPFWSLSFEAAYYAAAALMLFVRRAWGAPLVILLLLCAGPTIAILLPLWLGGFMTYRLRSVRLDRRAALLLAIVSAAMVAAAPILLDPIRGTAVGLSFPWGRGQIERDLGKDYVTAAAMIVHLIAARSYFSDSGGALRNFAVPLRVIGLCTFPLYAIHFPVLAFAAALSPFPHNDVMNVLWLVAAVVLTIAIVTPLCELLKSVIRDNASRIWPRPLSARRMRGFDATVQQVEDAAEAILVPANGGRRVSRSE